MTICFLCAGALRARSLAPLEKARGHRDDRELCRLGNFWAGIAYLKDSGKGASYVLQLLRESHSG